MLWGKATRLILRHNDKNHFMGIIGSVVGGLAGIGGAIGAGIAGRKAYKKIWGY